MKNLKYKELKAALCICIICITAIFAICAVMLFAPDVLPIFDAMILGICAGAMLLASIIILHYRTRRELHFYDALIDRFDDIGFIRFDKEKKAAIVSGEIEVLTGVPLKSNILQKKAYDELLNDIYKYKHDYEDGTYSSPDGNRWFRLASYEEGGIICTTIRDVTEYIEKINTINNLRFFDSLTGLLNKQAITDMLRRKIEPGYKSVAITHFYLIGIEKIISFEGTDAADGIFARIAQSVKSYEKPQSIFAGRTSGTGITVVLSQSEHEFDDYYKVIETINAGLIDTISELPENLRQYLKVYCGYIIYRGGEFNAEKMLAAADFAAYEAQKSNSTVPVSFDSASYKESANEFNKIRLFNDIISDEMIDYHFQPIVNARTGEIYGYEALMRPQETNGVTLTPLDVLKIAEEQNMLERVEKTTLFMTLKILSENQDIFQDKRLFVNSVSCVTLQDSEYCDLVDAYSELFPKLVIEITEANKLSDGIMPAMNKFFKPYKAHIALDDYGSGYSNDKTLLTIMPNYIKIDRSLITDINSDDNKKQLVSNIINYASGHGIYSLAEGVETEEELETVIYLGVDLIQGYLTCRPLPIFMREITPEIKSLVTGFCVKHAKRNDKVYEVSDSTPVDLVNIAVFGYTTVMVGCENASFFGDAGTPLEIRIICRDNSPVVMKFKNVNIHSDDFTALEVGENSGLRLRLEGDNTLSNQGIRVPATSSLTLEGDGNLTVESSFIDGVCIGGNSTQSFGRIDFDTTGDIVLTNKCDRCICIGGGMGSPDSIININSGRLQLHSRGIDAIGIGTLDGDILIMLNDCDITADVSGVNVSAIGSINGSVDIRSNAYVTIAGSGDNCCLIGTLHGRSSKIRLNTGTVKVNVSGNSLAGIGTLTGCLEFNSSADLKLVGAGDNCCLIGMYKGKEGVINISKGNISLTCNAKNIAGIGSLGGNCDIALTGIFDILCEGNMAICIGNLESGYINLNDVIINASSNSGQRQNIATGSGKIIITGGNILTNSIDALEAYSQFGSRLNCCHITGTGEPIEIMVNDNDSVYRYSAKPSPLFDDYYLYLPEGYKL